LVSVLTEKIAARLVEFYNENYPGHDYDRSEFLDEAECSVAVVREVLLSDEAIEAAEVALVEGGTRPAERILRAALDAVTTREEGGDAQ
jgi:hypothetical protein